MSKNYELLKQLDNKSDIGGQATAAAAVQSRSPRPEQPLDVRRPEMPRSALYEMERLVFKLLAPPLARQVVVFAAVDGGAPNVICAAAASVLAANVRGSVCVVDANFAAPRVAHYFSVDNGKGLADALTRPCSILEVAHRAPDVDLTTVAAGSSLKGEHLMCDVLKACIAELRSEFDFVLIDAPPLSASAAALALGRESDGVVVVVEADTDSREITHQAQVELQHSGVDVLGAVLNNRKFPIPDRVYSWLR